jgi:hypothetical protein
MGMVTMNILMAVFHLLDELLCRAGNQQDGTDIPRHDWLGEAHALVQSFMVGTADPSYVKQRLKELIAEREGKNGS